MERRIEYPLPVGAEGTVSEFLRHRQGLSARQFRWLRDGGGLLLDDVRARADDRLEGHDHITIVWDNQEPFSVEPNELSFGVIYEDPDLLIVDKPAGMPVHPSQGHQQDTLAGAVTGHWLRNGERHRFRPIGRLDRETSGLMAIAKNAWSAWMLEKQQQTHGISRLYSAVTTGRFTHMKGTVGTPIGRMPGSIILRRTDAAGQTAVTDYTVAWEEGVYTGLYIHLTTGRTHQIRVHMASIGHPLQGDGLYGQKKEPDQPLALCSCKLCLMHPVLHVPMSWSRPPVWETYNLAVTKIS